MHKAGEYLSSSSSPKDGRKEQTLVMIFSIGITSGS